MLVCAMNVSEGRDEVTLAALAAAGGPDLLDVHVDAHHHRAVLSLAGEDAPRAVALEALARIDLRRHAGAHPRLGAVDVVPFTALDGDGPRARGASDRFATWWTGRGVAVLRYGEAGPSLPEVRRGARHRTLPHPTAGATAVGVRGPLVAYNVWLAEADLPRARAIARRLRSPSVRALGLRLGDQVQVSMNLVRPAETGPAEAYDLVAAEAAVARAELVGLVPASVLDAVDRRRWRQLDRNADRTFEARWPGR